MLEERFNYHPGENTRKRRKNIKQAIQVTDFDTIYLALEDLQKKLEGYKVDRIQNDLSWLRQNSQKYYSEIIGNKTKEQNTLA